MGLRTERMAIERGVTAGRAYIVFGVFELVLMVFQLVDGHGWLWISFTLVGLLMIVRGVRSIREAGRALRAFEAENGAGAGTQ